MGITIEKDVILDGVPRKVIVPAEDTPAREGIPVDAYDVIADSFDMPQSYLDKFWLNLWDQGLIKPNDFLSKTAHKRFRQAYNLLFKIDILTVQKVIQETDNGY